MDSQEIEPGVPFALSVLESSGPVVSTPSTAILDSLADGTFDCRALGGLRLGDCMCPAGHLSSASRPETHLKAGRRPICLSQSGHSYWADF